MFFKPKARKSTVFCSFFRVLVVIFTYAGRDTKRQKPAMCRKRWPKSGVMFAAARPFFALKDFFNQKNYVSKNTQQSSTRSRNVCKISDTTYIFHFFR